jgi:hypothetical protein
MNISGNFSKLIVLVAFAGLLAFAGCKKKENTNFTVNYQYNYYPIDSGHYIIYNVDSVNFSYDNGSGHYYRDTNSYQMQAYFGDTIHDLLDSVNFRIYYSTRSNGSLSWGPPYETYGLRTKTNLQVVENDLRFIKLIFPPQLNQSWLGNIYIGNDPGDPNDPYAVFQGWNYNFENIDTTVIIAGQTYNNAIVVSEVNSVNYVTKVVRTEIYAPNVGMIYQEWESLAKQNVITAWDTGAESGFSIHMWAIAHNP